MSATVAAAVKAAIVILSNEEARKKVGWGIVAILSPLIVLVVLLCAILSGTSQHNVRRGAVLPRRLHFRQRHAGVPKIHRGYAEQL